MRNLAISLVRLLYAVVSRRIPRPQENIHLICRLLSLPFSRTFWVAQSLYLMVCNFSLIACSLFLDVSVFVTSVAWRIAQLASCSVGRETSRKEPHSRGAAAYCARAARLRVHVHERPLCSRLRRQRLTRRSVCDLVT